MPQSPDLPHRLPSLRRVCAALGLLWLTAAVALTAGAQRGTRPAAPAPPALPPLSMTCPMHPDVVERAPGTCPECKMNLIPVRLASGFTCPVHPVINETSAGTCAICGRALIPVTVSLTWSCRGEPNPDHLEPGVCADGTPRIAARTLRPHGNHNPRFGGQFFMAPDNWHHLEGTYPQARVFRLHVFDDYARPLGAEKLRQITARVVTHETFNAATRTSTELRAFPLTVTRDGALEARVDALPFPAVMTAKIRFTPDTPEYRFDFTFAATTTAPRPVAAPRTGAAGRAASGGSAPQAAPSPRAPATTRTPAARAAGTPAAAAPPGPDLGVVPFSIPSSVPEILQALGVRDAQVTRLVTAGDFGAVWVPAFQAKDLAIALEPSLPRLSPEARQHAEPAIQALVRAAWRLDAVGDLGNRQQVEAARTEFSARAAEIVAAFADLP
jgi:hypothetical protein